MALQNDRLFARVMQEIEAMWPQAVEDLVSLVRIPSVTGQENDAQAWMAKAMRDTGLEVDQWATPLSDLIDHPGYMNIADRETAGRLNLTGRWPKADGAAMYGRSLILNGHVDVVAAGSPSRWTQDPWAGTIVGNKLYGRGACDMKAGLLSGLYAIRALARAGIRLCGDVFLQSVIGEEEGTTGSLAALLRGYRADGVVVMEPSRLEVVPISAGVGFFRITVQGLSAHSSMRSNGVSALEKFWPIHQALVALEKEMNAEVSDPRFSGYEAPLSLNFHKIVAGDDSGTVPDRLVASGRFGFLHESETKARQRFEHAVQTAAAQDEWLSAHPPVVEWIGKTWSATPPDETIAGTMAQACERVLQRKPVVSGVTYRSDMHLFANVGRMPTVIFGPGDIHLAHYPDEHVPLDQYRQAIAILAMFMADWCGVQDASE